MKTVKKVVKILLKSLLGIIVAILLLLISSVLVSKHDFGTPSKQIGLRTEKISLSNINIVDVEADSGDMDSVIIRNSKILIEDGVIVNILPDSVAAPKGYQNIDGNGGYVLPGLMDMHTHVFDRSDLPMYLGHGVTTVRNMMGFPMHLRWREQVNAGKYPGSRLITASPTINSGNDTGPFHKNIETADEAAEAILKYKRKGYDFVKIYDGLNYEQFDRIIKTAGNQGLYVAGHPPHGIGIDTLLGAGLNSFEHIEEIVQGPLHYELDTLKGRAIAKKFKETNSRLTVTLSPFQNIYRTTVDGEDFLKTLPKDKINPFIEFIGQKQLGQWVNCDKGTYDWNVSKYECMSQLTKIFYEEDVELLLGTDTGPSLTTPGVTLLNEIKLLHDLGIPSFEIIKSGTIKSAEALQMENDIGSVTKGKQAELLLVSGNPLEDISTLYQPNAVIKDAILYTTSDLEKLKELGKDKSNSYLTIGRFLDHVFSK